MIIKLDTDMQIQISKPVYQIAVLNSRATVCFCTCNLSVPVFFKSNRLESLLLLGYEQFKHLRKSECAECIKQNMLPIRSMDEIGRKLTELFRGQDRKEKTLVII